LRGIHAGIANACAGRQVVRGGVAGIERCGISGETCIIDPADK